MKKLLSLALVGLALVGLAACSSSSSVTKESIEKKGKIVIATESEFAPFEFKTLLDGKDTLVGADIELGNAIAEKLGVDVEYSVMSFNNVLASLKSGKADMAIAGISVTSEREKAYDFSDSYYTSENVVIVKKSDLDTYTSADSLADKSVGAQKGSVQETVATEQLPKASMVSLTSNGEMINELKSGQLDAVVLEKAIAEGYIAQNDDLVITDKITLESDGTDAYAVAFAKGTDQEVIDAVNEVISEAKSSGQFDQWLAQAATYTQSSSSDE
ncbi:transporter substrate-binding domain-containing protein [Streptococcus loxodontisalivarius]|uniref:Polar amino acid transport system substrate-binding protein n=1 Tax=Streptococcus loxodontisalivarius TaxID=1349415 RepID=A0ABS2PTE6_9STRE|nr:transporter substrate-binding domain-containing protein [Streptococcus loxodontisalivarius]MBM7643317.1 polar amino acid transport system substrate-binding protein [Streptococcus loxodontisalivarius]